MYIVVLYKLPAESVNSVQSLQQGRGGSKRGDREREACRYIYIIIPSEARFPLGVRLSPYGFAYLTKISPLTTRASAATSLTPHVSYKVFY